ncbi:MAG: alkaline phosphatase family protein [Clostridia bacterium]|nr:alkaline phosphatase family protein [Clostridia bacterium]
MAEKRESITSVCAALCAGMGIEPPKEAAPANEALTAYLAQQLAGEKLDRVIMYNPDAIGEWVMEKYPDLFRSVTLCAGVFVPLETVMPSVTPVCFGSLYTGAYPEVHGIQKYEKPVIRIDSIFDALIRAGKKPAIVAYNNSSMGKIFLERKMDYFVTKGLDAANAVARELILRDEYDFLAIYNGNYDKYMHRCGPEGVKALGEADANAHVFGEICETVRSRWQGHRTLVGFAMDHGCHAVPDNETKPGNHGKAIPEDLFIRHYYRVFR